jgi:hypothetical protein
MEVVARERLYPAETSDNGKGVNGEASTRRIS